MVYPKLFAAAAATATLFTLCASPALAASGERTPLNLPDDEPARAASSAGGGGGMVRTIVGLAIVIAVIYGLYWILRQVKASREERASGHGLSTVATLPLGPNRSLHMVRAGAEIVLVGVSESGVSRIRTYSVADLEAAGALEQPDDGAGQDGAPPRAPDFPAPGDAVKRALDALRARTVRR